MGGFILVGCVAVIIIVSVSISVALEKRRREALQGVARDLGFTFVERSDDVLRRWTAGLKLFASGRGRRASNVLLKDAPTTAVAVSPA